MDQKAISSVRSPAICLIAVALFCLFGLAIGFVFDLAIVNVSMNHRSNTYHNAFARIAYAIIMAMVNVQIIRGAWAMLRLRNYGAAKQSAILALIPCVGPCFILGVPFGFWALSVLNDSHVKNSFADADQIP